MTHKVIYLRWISLGSMLMYLGCLLGVGGGGDDAADASEIIMKDNSIVSVLASTAQRRAGHTSI